METAGVSVRADVAAAGNVLDSLQNRIGPQKYNAWFRHGISIGVKNGHVHVSVPNSFVAGWIESHYLDDISAAAEQHAGISPHITVAIDPMLTGKLRKRQLDNQAEIVAKTSQGRTRARRPTVAQTLRYKLEDFVVGESNKLAYSAALAVAGAKKPPFNPLFIHGSCGVGKTHLLQAICNASSGLAGNGKAFTWRYVTGEQFTNDFIRAVRQRKFAEFRQQYRHLGLLAIDDVHFLAAKKGIQEEFLHTFNAIESAGKQIVLASDAHPKMVGELNAQLANRFVAGMVVKIEPPDRATRMGILRRKAAAMKLGVDEDVLEYVATHIRGSVRELEGTLIKLAALGALQGGPIGVSTAMPALADHLAQTDSALTLGDIEAAVAAYFGITPADLHSSRRTRTVTVARMLTMFLARRHTPMSYPEIGRCMGKNHSSVVLAVQRMEAAMAESKELIWTTPTGKKSMAATALAGLFNEQFS